MRELLPAMRFADDIEVSHITDDSREVRPGSLFVAVPGLAVDGRAFVADAERSGAVAVLSEAPAPAAQVGIPVVEIDGLTARRGEIAARFFGSPSKHMVVVAVTGTNGKTSCSHFIAQALSASGRKCGVLGTLGFGFPGSVEAPGLTTPGAIELQRRLAKIRDRGADSVALEASSHGLAQDRLNGTQIHVAVLTNITRDHLDYHETFAAYRAAKRRLFEWGDLDAAVINRDDPCFDEFVAATSARTVVSYSVNDQRADVYCASLTFRPDGFDAEVVTLWGAGSVSSALLGDFNVSNLLSTIAVLGLMGGDIQDICRWAAGVEGAAGRMDLLKADAGPSVVIDYAHTPDALEKALNALNRHKSSRLFCIVGCGGDRDKGKRPMMGALAADLADVAILTSDNPRGEDPQAIIDDMMASLPAAHRVHAIVDRAEAIAMALADAGEGDIVLIAGKGHEDYQDIGGRRIQYSDYAEVAKHIGERAGGGA